MMRYTVDVHEPEEHLSHVSEAQILVAATKNNQLQVTVYFMANAALHVTGGLAKTGMGQVKLYFTAVSTEAFKASISLQKLVFTFQDPDGMSKNFEFLGQAKQPN